MEAVLLAVEVAAPVCHQGGGVVPLQPGHEGAELRHDGGRQQQLVRQARLHHVGPGGAWHGEIVRRRHLRYMVIPGRVAANLVDK